MNFASMIMQAKEMGASDIHLISGTTPRCRVDGKLRVLTEEYITPTVCAQMVQQVAGYEFNTLMDGGELDTIYNMEDIRLRVNVFRQRGDYGMVLRIIHEDITSIEALKLPPIVRTFCNYKHGLVLITGETGSGKSTTLSAILNEVNHTQYKHILTLEDPIEFMHIPDKCVVTQREVGKDTNSFVNGLRAALREDPDIIMVGELRDAETISAALTAAETGHLVLGTLHTNSAAESVNRIVDIFPGDKQTQVRVQLAQCLRVVMSQQLVPLDRNGRIVACEIMQVESSIRSLIREGKVEQIPNALVSTASIGNMTMGRYLQQLFKARLISNAAYIEAGGPVEQPKK